MGHRGHLEGRKICPNFYFRHKLAMCCVPLPLTPPAPSVSQPHESLKAVLLSSRCCITSTSLGLTRVRRGFGARHKQTPLPAAALPQRGSETCTRFLNH